MGCSSSTAFSNSVPDKRCIRANFATDFFDHFRLDAKLGQGAFGQVRLLESACASQGSAVGQEPCVKIIDVRDMHQPGRACPRLLRYASVEVETWKSVGSHPNVTEFHGAYIQENLCFVVMEKCNCSLYNHVRDMPDLNEHSFSKLAFQMVSALKHLHASRVVHRDVKPDNFLVGGKAGDTVKLCDFGLAAFLPFHGKLTGLVGTAPFMCPEMIIDDWCDEKADIWSLGVTVYAFFFGNFPYVSKDGTKEGMTKAIVKGRTPKFESCGQRKISYSSSAIAFVTALLQRDAGERPSAEEVLKLPYVAMPTRGVALPSLKPMLEPMRKVGAIAIYNLSRRTDVDDLLRIMQLETLGILMPDMRKPKEVAKEESSISAITESTVCSIDGLDSVSRLPSVQSSVQSSSDGSFQPRMSL